MSKLSVSIAAASIIISGSIGVNSGFAQDKSDRSIDQYTCKDVMRESGESRDAAISFIHGYVLGKAGSATFDLETLEKQTDAFINRCLDNPGEKALDAMMAVKG